MLSIDERDRVFWASGRVLRQNNEKTIRAYFSELEYVCWEPTKFRIEFCNGGALVAWYNLLDLEGEEVISSIFPVSPGACTFFFSGRGDADPVFNLSEEMLDVLVNGTKESRLEVQQKLLLSLLIEVFGEGSSRVYPILDAWESFATKGEICKLSDFEQYLFSGNEVPPTSQPIRVFFGDSPTGDFLTELLRKRRRGLGLVEAVFNQRGTTQTSEIRRRAEDILEDGENNFIGLCEGLFEKAEVDSLERSFLRLLQRMKQMPKQEVIYRLHGDECLSCF